MDIQRSSRRIHILLVATALALVALASIAAGPAHAEDTFRFDNHTGEGFTAFSEGAPECWEKPSGALAWASEPHQSGSISVDIDPFDSCREWWSANLAYGQEFWEGYEANNGENVELWKGGIGTINFFAEDPGVGPATLRCAGLGEISEEAGPQAIENEMSTEVDGTDCNIRWLPGAGPSADSLDSARPIEPAGAKYSRFVDSLALVKGGVAHVSVQTFGLNRLEVEDRIALRTRGGQSIGQATTRLRVGEKAKLVAIRLAPVALQEIAKHGYLLVDAALTHVDGSKGDGDSTTQLVLRRDGVTRHAPPARPPGAAHH
jgi:hypothetical protein